MQNNIRRIREARGLSLENLAQLCGTDRSQVWRLEAGQRALTQSWMERLAKALACNPADLIDTGFSLAETGSGYRAPNAVKRATSSSQILLVAATKITIQMVKEGVIREDEADGLAIRAAEAAAQLGTSVTRHLIEHIRDAGKATDVDD